MLHPFWTLFFFKLFNFCLWYFSPIFITRTFYIFIIVFICVCHIFLVIYSYLNHILFHLKQSYHLDRAINHCILYKCYLRTVMPTVTMHSYYVVPFKFINCPKGIHCKLVRHDPSHICQMWIISAFTIYFCYKAYCFINNNSINHYYFINASLLHINI